MAQLRITAKKEDLPHGYPTFTFFKTKEGRATETQPLVGKKEVKWLVLDTDDNREIFERNLADSGIYSVEDINQKTPVPFKSGLKTLPQTYVGANAANPAPPKGKGK
jgi:hypothetical protein